MAFRPAAALVSPWGAPGAVRGPRQRVGARRGRGSDRVDRPPRDVPSSRSGNVTAPRVPGHKAAYVARAGTASGQRDTYSARVGTGKFADGRKPASPGSVRGEAVVARRPAVGMGDNRGTPPRLPAADEPARLAGWPGRTGSEHVGRGAGPRACSWSNPIMRRSADRARTGTSAMSKAQARLERRRASKHSPAPTDRRHRVRGEAIPAAAGARTAEPIVPAIEPDDRYPGIARREATDVAASRCRRCNRAARDAPRTKAIAGRPVDGGRERPISLDRLIGRLWGDRIWWCAGAESCCWLA